MSEHLTKRDFKNSAYGYLAALGKAMSSAPRLELLELLAQGPRRVDDLAQHLGQSVANTSHHLQVLKRAHLVLGQRQGKQIFYRLAGADVAELLQQLHRVGHTHIAALEKLKGDYFAQRQSLEAINADTLYARLEADEITLVDVRPAKEFDAAHIPGALSIPLADLEAQLKHLPKGKPIVAYCRGPFCAFSADAVALLREAGFDAQRAEVAPPFSEASE